MPLLVYGERGDWIIGITAGKPFLISNKYLKKEVLYINEEKVKALSDINAIDFLLDKNPDESAVVVTLNVFNRMISHYPEHFDVDGKAVIYKNENHLYFHNGDDSDIRVQKADRNLEEQEI
ncbi:hypothetical protein [Halobacillus massiliensis]|uniref:hypothetical protein n=1 Tax=Halobacillus massiliensis TaxID=1926286 RepID=UPI0009E401FB|nr:hypothetical protein [Halobacillus massiliensis]